MSIVVTGSLAFDQIMNFPGYFKDHILPEKVHVLSVAFLVNTFKKQRGGTATNIAYNIALMGNVPSIFGTVGEDFQEYRAWLEMKQIDTSLITEISDEHTATCVIMTDQDNNQITAFYPGAMSRASELSFLTLDRKSIDIAVLAPNAPDAMLAYAQQCRDLNIPFIADPGQQTTSFDGPQLLDFVRGARVLVGNDYEIELIKQKTGKTLAELCALVDILITTRGHLGSVLQTKEEEYSVPAAKVSDVVDPTGAGDAYRAGIVEGLLRGYSLETMGRLASVAAAYAIEQYGTQNHVYTRAEFDKRYEENFGSLPANVGARS